MGIQLPRLRENRVTRATVHWTDDGKVIELTRPSPAGQSASFRFKRANDVADALHYMSDIDADCKRALAAMAIALDLGQAGNLTPFEFQSRLKRTADTMRTSSAAVAPQVQRMLEKAATVKDEPIAQIASMLHDEATAIARELGATGPT
jgi:hypothetical protein